MKKTSKAQSSENVPLYQLKITLQWSAPPIWRQVVVRANMSLDRFHWVMQSVMGWTNSHMHQFVVGNTFYGSHNPDFGDMGGETLDEKRYTVADLAPSAKSKFIYEYDFGDSWLHEVKVEKILPADAAFKRPVCLGGKNACPPDDCGGMDGYYDMLEALADPKNPEHENMMEWIGGKWSPERFDLNEVNASLKRLKA